MGRTGSIVVQGMREGFCLGCAIVIIVMIVIEIIVI
jgi:hypothetical protein